jgi:hypothetical protein
MNLTRMSVCSCTPQQAVQTACCYAHHTTAALNNKARLTADARLVCAGAPSALHNCRSALEMRYTSTRTVSAAASAPCAPHCSAPYVCTSGLQQLASCKTRDQLALTISRCIAVKQQLLQSAVTTAAYCMEYADECSAVPRCCGQR